MLVMPGIALEEAMNRAEQARREVFRTPFEVGEQSIDLTVSVGVTASEPREASTAEWLLYSADTALYVAKAEGNRVESFGIGAGPDAAQNVKEAN